jgi:hypothetical protein
MYRYLACFDLRYDRRQEARGTSGDNKCHAPLDNLGNETRVFRDLVKTVGSTGACRTPVPRRRRATSGYVRLRRLISPSPMYIDHSDQNKSLVCTPALLLTLERAWFTKTSSKMGDS